MFGRLAVWWTENVPLPLSFLEAYSADFSERTDGNNSGLHILHLESLIFQNKGTIFSKIVHFSEILTITILSMQNGVSMRRKTIVVLFSTLGLTYLRKKSSLCKCQKHLI